MRTSALLSLVLGLSLSTAATGCRESGSSVVPGSADGEAAATEGDDLSAAQQRAKEATLIDLANDSLGRGRYVSAAKLAQDALADNPENADAWAVMGASLWRAGDLGGSTEAFEKAIAVAPSHYGAGIGLARNLQAAGNHARAIEIMDRLIEDDPSQLEPFLTKHWSYYAQLDVDHGLPNLDKIFSLMATDDPRLTLVQANAVVMRALSETGDLLQIKGERGTMDVTINHNYAIKYSGAVAGDSFTQVVFKENAVEAQVDPGLVEALGLKAVGSVKQMGTDTELELVVIPSLAFGDLSITNVPAVVTPLGAYAPEMGETPGVVLGRQAMAAFGSITFDFPNATLTVTKDAAVAKDGAIEAPLHMLSLYVAYVPTIPVTFDGSDHTTYVYLGGFERSSVVVTRKAYLKSGHLPRSLENPEDPELGLKIVLMRDVAIGGEHLGGYGGLVLVNEPPDANLNAVLQESGFELGGYINTRLMGTWAMTYDLQRGKVMIQQPS